MPRPNVPHVYGVSGSDCNSDTSKSAPLQRVRTLPACCKVVVGSPARYEECVCCYKRTGYGNNSCTQCRVGGHHQRVAGQALYYSRPLVCSREAKTITLQAPFQKPSNDSSWTMAFAPSALSAVNVSGFDVGCPYKYAGSQGAYSRITPSLKIDLPPAPSVWMIAKLQTLLTR